jgi:uncharacterized protein
VSLERDRPIIEGPAGDLEAVADEAEGVAQKRYAVVCHPHPLYGGTMDNKVVYTLARALQSVGIATLRFNFRGVGKSAGAYDHGRGETSDAAAVADYGASRWPGRELVLAGFSFGAYVALSLASQRRTAQLVTVAPPVGRFEFDFSPLGRPGCPWLLVQGEADELVDPRMVLDWAQSLEIKPDVRVVPGAGHLFHGQLVPLREAVRETLRSG